MVSELQVQVGQLETETRELEASKASHDKVNQLFDNITLSIALLNDSKVDNSDFSDTVSELVSTKATVTELEVQLHDLAETALNHTHYDQLQDGIDRLESSKASQTQFEELVSNFTSLANTTVRTSEFLLLSERVEEVENTTEDLTTEVTTLQDDIEWINVTLTTKASQDVVSDLQDEIHQLFHSIGLSIALLNDSKVDTSVFNDFIHTVSKLIGTKADRATVMELGEELTNLTETALNHTHYDQLQDGIDRLESSKASQTQFEELVSNFTSLANTTVRTNEFLHLSERVEDIDDTTVKEEEFSTKVATLEGDIEHINRTLDMKADRQDIMDEITSLRDTTVRRDEFQGLSDDVETLQTSKADQSDLDDLDDTVTHLG